MTVAEPPTTSPKVAGKEPIFRHLDDPDMGFRDVRAQRNADGTESYVREKWLAFSPDPQYLSLYAEYDPGMVVRRHGHFSPHIVFNIWRFTQGTRTPSGMNRSRTIPPRRASDWNSGVSQRDAS